MKTLHAIVAMIVAAGCTTNAGPVDGGGDAGHGGSGGNGGDSSDGGGGSGGNGDGGDGGGPWSCDDVSDCKFDLDPADCEFAECVDGGCVYGTYLHGGSCGTPEHPGTCESGECVPIDAP